jgi:hypothetical protein
MNLKRPTLRYIIKLSKVKAAREKQLTAYKESSINYLQIMQGSEFKLYAPPPTQKKFYYLAIFFLQRYEEIKIFPDK